MWCGLLCVVECGVYVEVGMQVCYVQCDVQFLVIEVELVGGDYVFVVEYEIGVVVVMVVEDVYVVVWQIVVVGVQVGNVCVVEV